MFISCVEYILSIFTIFKHFKSGRKNDMYTLVNIKGQNITCFIWIDVAFKQLDDYRLTSNTFLIKYHQRKEI